MNFLLLASWIYLLLHFVLLCPQKLPDFPPFKQHKFNIERQQICSNEFTRQKLSFLENEEKMFLTLLILLHPENFPSWNFFTILQHHATSPAFLCNFNPVMIPIFLINWIHCFTAFDELAGNNGIKHNK